MRKVFKERQIRKENQLQETRMKARRTGEDGGGCKVRSGGEEKRREQSEANGTEVERNMGDK